MNDFPSSALTATSPVSEKNKLNTIEKGPVSLWTSGLTNRDLLDGDKLDLKDQGRIGAYHRACSSFPVRKVRRDE
jgi:hypothetical protein